MKEALEAALGAQVTSAVQLAGGASKEAWAVDTEDGRTLFVRRAGGGVIHGGTLALRDEFELLVAAREEAFALVKHDPHLREPLHAAIRGHLLDHYRDRLEFVQIG